MLELYLGIPIFPGNSIYDMMYKIVELIGYDLALACNLRSRLPHDDLIERAKCGSQFFKNDGKGFRLKTPEEYQMVRTLGPGPHFEGRRADDRRDKVLPLYKKNIGFAQGLPEIQTQGERHCFR